MPRWILLRTLSVVLRLLFFDEGDGGSDGGTGGGGGGCVENETARDRAGHIGRTLNRVEIGEVDFDDGI